MMRIHKKVQQGQMPIADVVKTVCHDKYANLCRAKGQISFAPDIFLFYPSTKHRRAEYLFGKTFSILETENPDKAWDSVCHIYYTDTKHHHIYKLSTYYESNQIKIAILRSQLFILMDLLLWYSLMSSDAYVPSVASQKYQ